MSPATRFVQVAENRAGAGAGAAVDTLLRLLPGWGVLVVAGESDPPSDGRWDVTVDRATLAKAGAEYAGYFAAGAEKVVRVRASDKYLTHAMLMAQRALAALPGVLLLAGCRQALALAPELRLMVSGGVGEEWDAGARDLRPLIDLTVVNLPGVAEQPIADDINPCAFADLSAKSGLPMLREWLAKRVGA